MSKIVRGPSAEIRNIQPGRPHQTTPGVYKVSPFKAFVIEGNLSDEELAAKLAVAKAEGVREAEAKLTAQVRMALGNVENLLDELSRFRRELFKESEEDVLEMVKAISKKVVMKELTLDPGLMKTVVEKGLSILEKQKKIHLEVSPQDLEFYQKAKPDFIQKLQALEELRVESNSQLESGQASIQSATLELDVRLEAMVDHLMAQVKAANSVVTSNHHEGDTI